MMINLFAVARFSAKFLLIYLVLILAGSYINGIQKKITASYVNKGSNYFEAIGTKKRVKFKPLHNENWIIKIEAYDNKVMKNNWGELNLWGIIYLPLILFVSLTIDKTEPGYSGGLFYDIVNGLNLIFIDNVNVYLLYTVIIWFFVAFRKESFLQKLS